MSSCWMNNQSSFPTKLGVVVEPAFDLSVWIFFEVKWIIVILKRCFNLKAPIYRIFVSVIKNIFSKKVHVFRLTM